MSVSSVATSWSVINPSQGPTAGTARMSRFVKVKLGLGGNQHVVRRPQQPQQKPEQQPRKKARRFNPHRFAMKRDPNAPMTDSEHYRRTINALIWPLWPPLPREPSLAEQFEIEAKAGHTQDSSSSSSNDIVSAREEQLRRHHEPLQVPEESPKNLRALVSRMNFILHSLNRNRNPVIVAREPPSPASHFEQRSTSSGSDELTEDETFYFLAGPNEAASIFLALQCSGGVAQDACTTPSHSASAWDDDAVERQHPLDQEEHEQKEQDPFLLLPESLSKILFLVAMRARARFLLPPLRVALFWWLCRNDQFHFSNLRQAVARMIIRSTECAVAAKQLAQSDEQALSPSSESVQLFFSLRRQLSRDIVVGGLCGNSWQLDRSSAVAYILKQTSEWCDGGANSIFATTRFGPNDEFASAALVQAAASAIAACPRFELIRDSVRILGAAWTIPELTVRTIAALEEVEAASLSADDSIQLLEWCLVFGQRFLSAKEREMNKNRSSSNRELVTPSQPDEPFVQVRVKLIAALSKRISGVLSEVTSADHQQQQHERNAHHVRRLVELLQQSLGGLLSQHLRRHILCHGSVSELIDRIFAFVERHGTVVADRHHQGAEEEEDQQQQRAASCVLPVDLAFFVSFMQVAVAVNRPDVAERFLAAQLLPKAAAAVVVVGENSNDTLGDGEFDDLLASLDASAESSSSLSNGQDSSSSNTSRIAIFFRTSDVLIWSLLTEGLLSMPSILAAPAILDNIVQNGADIAAKGIEMNLRGLGLLCRLVGVLFEQQRKGADSIAINKLEALVKQIDTTLLDIITHANEKIRVRSTGGGSDFFNNNAGTVGEAQSKNMPPISCDHLLFFLASFDKWPRTQSGGSDDESKQQQQQQQHAKKLQLQYLSSLEPLARDAIGHTSTRDSQVVEAMLAFLDRKQQQFELEQSEEQRRRDQMDEKEEEELRKRQRELASASSSSSSSSARSRIRSRHQLLVEHSLSLKKNASLFSDNLLLEILTARLVRVEHRSGGYTNERIFEREHLVPLARFLVLAGHSGSVDVLGSSNRQFRLAVEAIFVNNQASERLDIRDLNELAVLALFKLGVPPDGAFAMSVLDRYKESALAMPDLSAVHIAARVAISLMGEGVFGMSDLRSELTKRAVDLVRQM